jgi:VanZ family protein
MSFNRTLWIHGSTAGWAILIFIFSSIPSLKTPDLGFGFSDKAAHVFEFTVFGYLLERSFNHIWRISFRIYLLVFLCGALFALSDEIHQFFVVGREADFGDFIADMIGILVGQLVFWKKSR